MSVLHCTSVLKFFQQCILSVKVLGGKCWVFQVHAYILFILVSKLPFWFQTFGIAWRGEFFFCIWEHFRHYVGVLKIFLRFVIDRNVLPVLLQSIYTHGFFFVCTQSLPKPTSIIKFEERNWEKKTTNYQLYQLCHLIRVVKSVV